MEQLMLLSLPSSGSDWLCRLIAEHCSTLSYFDKEWFNPICNLEHELALGRGFGCEMPSYAGNITRKFSDSLLERVYEDTWVEHASGRFNFDKEVYSFARVIFFAQRFRTAVLYRAAEDTFPPTRLRVWSWYDAIWKSLFPNDMSPSMPADRRALSAHAIAGSMMLRDARKAKVPVICYRDLMLGNAPVVRDLLSPWLHDHLTKELVESIIETRVPRFASAV